MHGSGGFLVAWLPDAAPTRRENQLLDSFASEYGALPFANIAGPRGADAEL